MATSKAPKTYQTSKLDKKHFNFNFLWRFRGLWYKRLKWTIGLVQKVEIFKMVSKMAAILKRKLNLKSKWQSIIIFW